LSRPFKLEVSLLPGTYQYKFIVDGVWKYDPYDSVVDDEIDNKSNIIHILPQRHHDGEEEAEVTDFVDLVQPNQVNSIPYKIMKIVYQFSAESVAILGSWNNWKDQIPLKKIQNNFSGSEEFYVVIRIPSGNYHFKFLVNGSWMTSPTYPLAKDSTDVENNILVVPSLGKGHRFKYINWAEKGTLEWKREESKWTECGTIHHTFQGHSMNVVCDLIYIFGGMANNKFTNTLYIYDPRTNEFSLVDEQNGDIPGPRAFHQ
jgi:hypothetical protein